MGLNKRQLQKDKKELTKAKAPSKPKDVFYTENGQYDFPGEITKVPTPTGRITMVGVNQPLYGVDNTGYAQMMYPENEYQFPGDVVTEYPQEAKRGGTAYELTKPTKKGLNSKKYSRSLMATNRLFLVNPLFKKPKSKKRKIFDPNAKYYQDGGEQDDYVYIDNLSPDEIEEYAKGGYVIEDISIPSLNQYDEGGIFKRRKKKKEQQEQLEYRPPVEVDDELYESVTPYAEAPEDFKKGVGNIKEVEKKAQAPDWLNFSKEYEKKNSKQAFIDEKKREYLKGTNQGLLKARGYNMENFPPDVERRFEEAYDYKKNSYIVKKLGKKYDFSPNRRGEWVDYLSGKERDIVANSKFESKLQPSLWDRTLAGLGTLAAPFSPEINAAMNEGELPGLTKREQREIKDSKITKVPFTDIDLPFGIPVGGLESLSWWDAPGVAIANALEQSGNSGYGAGYREAPSTLSAQPMANVKPEQAMVLNPLNYTLPYDITPTAASLVRGIGKLGKFAKSAPAVINKKLIENVGRFGKFKYGELPVNLDPSQISRLNQIDEARGIDAYSTLDKSNQLTKFLQNTKLSDDDIIKIFGKTKEELLDAEQVKKATGIFDNQMPPPPDTIIIDPVTVGRTSDSLRPAPGSPEELEQYLDDLEQLEDDPARALALNPDRALQLYDNPSTRNRLVQYIPNIEDLRAFRNDSRISENQNFLDHLEDIEDNIYDYLMNNSDITTMLLNDHTTQPRVREILLAGRDGRAPRITRNIENDYSAPAYTRRNQSLAEELRRAEASRSSRVRPTTRYTLDDITMPEYPELNKPTNSKSVLEEIVDIPKNVKGLFSVPTQKLDHWAVPSLYAAGFRNKRAMLESLNSQIETAFDLAKPGSVITGSKNTSHNSYLPQMDYIFKNAGKEGLSEPVFLGYEPMNQSGFLSAHGESLDDILEYINHNLNKIQKRSGKNLNLGMYKPYIDEERMFIHVPQYGLRKTGKNVAKIVKEEGGEIILNDLTDDQLKEYLDGGYIVEKIN